MYGVDENSNGNERRDRNCQLTKDDLQITVKTQPAAGGVLYFRSPGHRGSQFKVDTEPQN